MEQEGVTLVIITATIVVLVFAIAMVVLFVIFQNLKSKLLIDNRNLSDVIRNNSSTFKSD